MSAPDHPFLEDRPLRRSDGDLLGFDRIAEGLAARLGAARSSGMLAAVTARTPGAGRSSFLNLLHAALVERGVAVLRFSGDDDLPALLRQARTPAGLPQPVALVDDAEPELLAELDAPDGAPALVAAWRPTADPAGGQRRREQSPLLVELPGWSVAAAAAWTEALRPAPDDDERSCWVALLATAASPRRAKRLALAALTAAAACDEERPAVLAALAASLGLDQPPGLELSRRLPGSGAAELIGFVSSFCGAVELDGGEAERERASTAQRVFGGEPPVPPELAAEALEPAARTAPAREERLAPASGEANPEITVERRRRRCVELAGRGGPASTEELLRLLADEHPSVRLSASHALAALADPAAAPELRRLLGGPDASLRRTAAFVLGRLGDEGSRDELVRLLVDVNPSVRRAAAAALGKLGGDAVVRPLLLALDDGHAGVRMAAETALSRMLASLPEDRVDDWLLEGETRVRRAAARAAGRLGVGSRETLESLLGESGELAIDAAEALGRRRETASLPALAAGAAGDRGDLRTACLAAIGRIADGSAAQGLAGLLSQEDADTRDAAARALARCPGAFEAVLPYLREDDPHRRRSVVDALGRCGDRRAIGPLLEVHDGEDGDLRRAAAASLVRLGFDP